jgi:uncharacterized protein
MFLPHLLPFATAIAIIAAASALQAATGMGMALFAAPLLALVNPVLVPGPMLCCVVALSLAVAWRERLAIDPRVLRVSLLGLMIGCGVGAVILLILDRAHLRSVFAMLILAMVLLSVSGLQLRANRVALLIGGMASGVVGTMFGVHGPPIALVLQHEPPNRLRATLCAFFAVGCTVSLFALAGIGAFDTAGLGRGLALLPGVAIGFALAPPLARRIDRRRARIAVLVISALSALALLLR